MTVTIEDVGQSSKIFPFIFGDPGIGKTSLIGTGGKKYKTLIVRPPADHTDPIIGSGCKETIVRDWEEIWEVLEYLRYEGHNWDWVWLDSISLLQDFGLDDVYENTLDFKGPQGSAARKAREQFGPDKGEYRVNMWRLEQWIRHTVGSASFNFGVTAHPFWYEPQDGDMEPYLMPWVQGKNMPNKICGMMNLVGYYQLREREVKGTKRQSRVLHTNKSVSWYGKNQFKLPDGTGVFGPTGSLVNPTIEKMVELINKGRIIKEDDGKSRSRRRSATRRPVNRRTATKGSK
jgi:hypothetical protein